MDKQARKEIQDARDNIIRKQRDGKFPIIKSDSLNIRARKLGITTDMPNINRYMRRRDLKVAVRERSKTKDE